MINYSKHTVPHNAFYQNCTNVYALLNITAAHIENRSLQLQTAGLNSKYCKR